MSETDNRSQVAGWDVRNEQRSLGGLLDPNMLEAFRCPKQTTGAEWLAGMSEMSN